MSAGLKRSQLIDQMSKTTQEGATATDASFFIAASDATDVEKAIANETCTGSSDDVIINAAIAALPTTGGRILLSSGHFYIADSITILNTSAYRYFTLAGMGDATVLSTLAADPLGDHFIKSAAETNRHMYLTFKDFRISGDGDTGTTIQTAGDAIRTFGASYSRYINLTIRYCYAYGLCLNGDNTYTSVDQLIQGCHIAHNGDDGIYMQGNATDVTVIGNTIFYNGGYGVYATGGGLIIGNRIYSNTSNGVHSNGYRVIIKGNNIDGTGISPNCISLGTAGYYNIIEGNILKGAHYTSGTSGYAIRVGAGTTNNQIKNNYFADNNDKGAVSDGGTNTFIFGNEGYIAPGEIRTLKGSISTLTENAYNSVDNPFGQDVLVLDEVVYISTKATSGSPRLDCGIGSSATTDYTTLFDDITCETAGPYHSVHTATIGKQTTPILWQTGTGNRYLNHSIKDAAATGMVAKYMVRVMGV